MKLFSLFGTVFLFSSFLLIFPRVISAQSLSAWENSFVPIRERYVSPTGTGTGSFLDPMSISTALTSAQPGDLIWFKAGEYAGDITLTRAGTVQNPIVYRARKDERAIIRGRITIPQNAAYNWIWGFEITANTVPHDVGDGVGAFAPGTRLIHNVIHDIYASNGIGAWKSGSGSIFYGNILYGNGRDAPNNPHGIYIQNTYATSGYKYFINNISIDSHIDVGTSSFNFHGYGDSEVSGLYLQGNIFRNGRVLLGGSNYPADNEKVINNYFYVNPGLEDKRLGAPQLGYHTPSQAEVTGNYIGRGSIMSRFFWAGNDQKYTKTKPNIYTNNEIHYTDYPYLLETARWTSNTGSPVTGTPPIDPIDVVDNNTYSFASIFSFWISANGTRIDTGCNISCWRNASKTAGKEFDIHSSVVSLPTTPKIGFVRSQYESNRTHIVIYNWGNQSHVSVDVSSLLSSGTSYKLVKAKDFYGTPVLSGVYTGGSLSVPITTEQEVFVLIASSITPPPSSSTPSPTPTLVPTSSPTPTASPRPSPTPSPRPGDANMDNSVDGIDYTIWLLNYNKEVDGAASQGDFDTNRKVDGVDYLLWLVNYLP